eukprot:UN06352
MKKMNTNLYIRTIQSDCYIWSLRKKKSSTKNPPNITINHKIDLNMVQTHQSHI